MTKKIEKLIKSLKVKKYRHNLGLYIAEGTKVVEELINSGTVPKYLLVTEKSACLFQEKFDQLILVDDKTIKELSQLSTPNEVIGIFEMPFQNEYSLSDITLILDNINDPGNMGTIIRTADWFGIKNIVCSKDSVDIYNSKTIQSTMGSIGRVNVYYEELIDFIEIHKEDVTLYATTLGGKELRASTKPSFPSFIIIGNESHGISKPLLALAGNHISIGRFGKAESLNAAIATSIMCYHFRLFGN